MIMKPLLLTTLALALASALACEKKALEATEASILCSQLPEQVLAIAPGDDIDDSPFLTNYFSKIDPDIYMSGGACTEVYRLREYDEVNEDWCFDSTVDIDCSSGVVKAVDHG